MSECFGTTTGVQSKNDALFSVAMLYLFGYTTREIIEATLLVNISAKLVYQINQNEKQHFNYNVVTHDGKVVLGGIVPYVCTS